MLGYLDDDNGGEIRRDGRWPSLGRITDLEPVLMREVIDEVIFLIEKGRLQQYEEALLVAERHGGSLQLESAGEDKGTTVRVRLPL